MSSPVEPRGSEARVHCPHAAARFPKRRCSACSPANCTFIHMSSTAFPTLGQPQDTPLRPTTKRATRRDAHKRKQKPYLAVLHLPGRFALFPSCRRLSRESGLNLNFCVHCMSGGVVLSGRRNNMQVASGSNDMYSRAPQTFKVFFRKPSQPWPSGPNITCA